MWRPEQRFRGVDCVAVLHCPISDELDEVHLHASISYVSISAGTRSIITGYFSRGPHLQGVPGRRTAR